MKILAVSDMPSRSLETIVLNDPGRLRDINIIVSCGDLDREYVEFLADGLNRQLFFVSGNHVQDEEDLSESLLEKIRSYSGKVVRLIAGRPDLHGRIEVHGDYIIAGFGGSMWYNGSGNQYTEKEMARVVRSVERKIRWYRRMEKLLSQPPREVIVISHAPLSSVHDLPDTCHTGFKCFHAFVRNVSPVLWVHGHIHLQEAHRNQISVLGSSTVVNAFGCKVIDIENKNIHVISHCF